VYKMPGDEWQQFANLRALYFFMYTHPGTKLLFMGSEFGQTSEWNFDQSLDWHLLEYEPHQGIYSFVKALNQLYRSEPALYELSFNQEGFEWIEHGDSNNSSLVYMRKGIHASDNLLMVLNLTPMVHKNSRVGVPASGIWDVILNSDDRAFYG